MTRLGRRHKFEANNWGPRRALPCLVPEHRGQIPRKALPTRRICHRPRSSGAAGIIRPTLAPDGTSGGGGTTSLLGCCPPWATWWLAAPLTSIPDTPNPTVPGARNVLRQICLTMRCPRPITRSGWDPWPCAWSLKRAYPIKPPVGLYGAPTGCLGPLPPARTGWKAGDKKAIGQMDGG